MAKSNPASVSAYLASLPPDRAKQLRKVREIILKNLPAGYKEGVQYGMIGYYVPFDRLRETYNGQPLGYAALGNHKSYMTLYLNNVYGDPETDRWFRERYQESGKKLDMGKSCVHFKSMDDLPLDVVGEAIARTPVDEFVAKYEAARKNARSKKPRSKKA